MSINFDNLLYCSVYGSSMALPKVQSSVTISGSIGAGGSTNFDGYFELGRAFGSFPDPPAIYIPKPTVTAYVNSATAPNNASRWYKVGTNPRPFILGSSAGDLNLTISMYRLNSTASSPALYNIEFSVYNAHDVTATITTTVINYIAYAFANS